MQTTEITREVLADGSIKVTGADCTFLFSRIRPGALLVTIKGLDAGQFGTSTLDEIRMELLRHRPLELFVDARDALGAAVSVSEDWTKFFSFNREQLKRVSVLVGSKVVHLTVAIAQHLPRTGNLIQIYSDHEVFQGQVDLARAAT
jgi:hypothetical protein